MFENSTVTFVQPASFILFEALVSLLFVMCLAAATSQRRVDPTSSVFELLAITLYGLAIEELSVLRGLYDYGDFGLMAYHAPLVIGMGWGVIVFAAMRLSDQLAMPEWARPFLDALLALLVDFGMDVVAIRDLHWINGRLTGMWNWGIGFDQGWFGVPLWNFAGWWLIVLYISACLRVGRWAARRTGRWAVGVAYPWLAAVAAVLMGGLHVIRLLPEQVLLIVFLALSVGVTAATWRGVRPSVSPGSDLPAWLTPLSFHVFFLSLMLARGLWRGAPALLPIGVGVLGITLGLHGAVWWMGRRSQSTPHKT